MRSKVMRMNARAVGRRSADGQVLVVFALAVVVLLGFGGLALDGGSTFAQRRDEQTAADLAALAGANDYLINGNHDQAVARARATAASNGYTHGVAGTTVDVDVDTSNGIGLSVSISALHHNTIVGLLGMPTWTVTVAGTALAGFPDTAHGVSPFIFSAAAFSDDGTPMYQTPTNFGETNGDVPTSQLDFAWTNFGTGNLNSSEVSSIIDGSLVLDKTLAFGEYIGQYNNGNHTTLFEDVDTHLSGLDVPSAIVDGNGNFVGWSIFHVISASGSSSKHVRGYFVSSFESARLTITSCAANDCPRYLGAYVLKLSD
jgi:Flp pilus assembly protein TadG